jgi:uncharacterized protein (DUF1697 family)
VITHIALLRGINVGGNNKLAMTDLAKIFVAAGATEVSTYIQSGNVLFRATAAVAKQLPAAVEAAIAKRHKLQIPIVMRTAAELAAVVAANPHRAPLERIYVAFLAAAPAAERIALLDPRRSPGDTHVVIGAEIYLNLGNGAGKTKLTNAYFDGKLGTISTMRNWNTVVKLHLLATSDAASK